MPWRQALHRSAESHFSENPPLHTPCRGGVVYAVYAISIVSFFISTRRLVARNSASWSPGIGLA